jgi:hypothetical protein
MERIRFSHIVWIFIIIFLGCIVLYPLGKPGFIVTDDGNWMVIRFSAFYQSLRDGQFPVRFLGRLNDSYGYPVANFLYPGFMYIGSLIKAMGFSFQETVEVIIASSVIFGSVTMYLWLNFYFKPFASFLGSLSFLFSPYLLYDLYKRGSVGELLAILFAIITCAAIDKKAKWVIPISALFLAISHNTLAFFFIPLVLIYAFIKKQYKTLGYLGIGFGMSIFFWGPALAEQSIVVFSRMNVSNPEHFFDISTTILMQSSLFFLAGVLSFFGKKKQYHNERLLFFTVVLIVSVITTTLSSSIWNIPLFAKVIQFPYRFFSLLLLAGPWFVAYIADKNWFAKLLSVVGIAYFVFIALPYSKTESIIRPDGFYTTNEATTTVADEYMPKWVTKKFETRPTKKIDFYVGSGIIHEKKVNSQIADVVIEAKEPSIVQINTLYYPGWGGMLDNKKADISTDNPYGVMQIAVPIGAHHLYMAFRETPTRFIFDLISVVFFILYIVIVICKKS